MSPLTSDSSSEARAKLAGLKTDYIIQSQKNSATLKYFKEVNNEMMGNIEYDNKNQHEKLPSKW